MTAEEIANDVKKRIAEIFEKAAYDISFEIEGQYESCIDAFYNSYSPRSYNRGHNLYKGSSCRDNIMNEYKCEINDDISWFQAGIRILPSTLGNPYHDPQEYVFNRSYMWGIHGTIGTGGIMIVPPERLMSLWFEGFKANLGSYMKRYF